MSSRTTVQDALIWARIIVRTCEDMGIDGLALAKARIALADIEDLLGSPTEVAKAWVRCDIPMLHGYVEQAEAREKPERARLYEAIIAVRLLAVEAAEACS